VFISFHPEATRHAEELASSLRTRDEQMGVFFGGDHDAIPAALAGCELVVVLASQDCGQPSDGGATSTYDQLVFVRNTGKPLFLVKMCDQFGEAMTKLFLPSGMLYMLWRPHTRIPWNLENHVMGKLNALQVCSRA
jgi:hypothetical protein